MVDDFAGLIVILLAFGTAALATYVAVDNVLLKHGIRRRFQNITMVPHQTLDEATLSARRYIRFSPAQLGINLAEQRRLRSTLIHAGFFNQDGVVIYTIGKWVLLGLFPLTGAVVLANLGRSDALTKITAMFVLLMIAYFLPRAFLSRRQRWLQDKYRVTFPDVLDMLVVCVNAGLSLDAALNRVTQEFGPENAELRANLDLMAGEMRAGRSSVEALKDCAERLGLPEAMSLATLLQQSIELGTDVATSLTTFSDEMRDKRMSRAEEKAAALPPKLTLPLGLFIFPVVLIVVLTPVVLRIIRSGGI
ncbi:MAG: type II secretion system F family protein [Burkholderiaceae bacterium]